MSSEIDKSHYVLPQDQPVVALEVATAFNGLTLKEKQYAHHISKASWIGGLITMIQTSVESAPAFVFFHKLFSAQKPEDFKAEALKNGFTEDEVKAVLIYVCGLFSNAGNYKSFGDTKFVPNLDVERLEGMVKLSPVWPELKNIWETIKEALYDLGPGRTCLGYPPHGCTTYLSKNCTEKDNEIVTNWLKTQNIEAYNTRLFKTEANGKVVYEVRYASVDRGEIKCVTEGNITYKLTCGDYSPIIAKVAQSLREAKAFAANEKEEQMLEYYAQSFVTGSLDDHKTGSRYWIQDKGPAVETYIGFIETYRDPAGVRGEFEGFVAAVNRPMSAKFATLVAKAEEFLETLPWPKGFEKDKFLKPDFTSLDVVTFAGSGIPAGINIPNYNDIKQTEGFKNVSLGNVIPASYQMTVTPFLSQTDEELLKKYRVSAFELQVGLHELLGHGSGKLLHKEQDGSFNFSQSLVDPLSGKAPTSWYEPGDTYDTVFGPLSSSYEECRAEAVGLYLCTESKILEIFGHEGEEADNIVYVNWLSLIWAGAGRALEMWDPNRGWLQAHSQARYVLARVLIEAGVVEVTQPKPDDLLVTVDRAAIPTKGRQAIGEFLRKLQIYKSTANIHAAQEMYDKYSEVKGDWVNWRGIILANKQPRKIFVQSNTYLDDNEVKLKTYEASTEGLIHSWVDRFDDVENIYSSLLDLSKSDAPYF